MSKKPEVILSAEEKIIEEALARLAAQHDGVRTASILGDSLRARFLLRLREHRRNTALRILQEAEAVVVVAIKGSFSKAKAAELWSKFQAGSLKPEDLDD